MEARLYNPIRLVEAVKRLGMVQADTDLLALYETACELEMETRDWWDEDEGFGSSDIFGDIVSLARTLGYTYDKGQWKKL